MTPTKQQAQAIDQFIEWFKSPIKRRNFFQLAGYAGTGKTTIAKHLAESIGGRVYFAAYTGKAAHRLIQSGCQNVSTIHKLIYVPKIKSQQHLKELEADRAEMMTHNPIPRELIAKINKAIENERKNLDRPAFSLNLESPLLGADLLIVDEYSMIDQVMGEDLLSFNIPILALGDPGQLPPVKGSGFFGTEPDVLLTDIQRQALDSPVIWLATEVRQGRTLKPGTYGNCSVTSVKELGKEKLGNLVIGCDQLLVGKNATRTTSNNRVRDLIGKTSTYPMVGDKLVCLKNNHEKGLLNGQIWYSESDSEKFLSAVILNLRSEEGEKIETMVHPHYFEGTEPDFWEQKSADSFTYGYALTVHKAQGSEFGKVVLFDEWFNQNRREWLYTGITRASESITIVSM